MKNAKEKILNSIKKGAKEIAKIESGKMKATPAKEVLDELIKERDGRGGARAGAGKKSPLQATYPNEKKELVTVRLYPTQLKKIESKYGSLQHAVDIL